MKFDGTKNSSQSADRERITPELVRAIADRVYVLLLRERELVLEQTRQRPFPARRRGSTPFLWQRGCADFVR